MKMTRRDAVRITSTGFLLGPLLAGKTFAQKASAPPTPIHVNGETALLAELVEVIIPATDTPGAKAAGVHEFVLRVLRDCYPPEEQRQFEETLRLLRDESRSTLSEDFVRLTHADQATFLKSFAVSHREFFKTLKHLTVLGYFNSEIGATQALAYMPVPGRFDGSAPLEPGQKAWAL